MHKQRHISAAEIIKIVSSQYDLGKILFITTNFGLGSHDLDIYCVANNQGKSKVYIYSDNELDIEIFIDKWSDLKAKINNYDEIVLSFIRDMEVIYKKGKNYEKTLSLLPTKYILPLQRYNLLLYRLKVLTSKFDGATNDLSKKTFAYQLASHLSLYYFHRSGIFPQSPKKWFDQLKTSGDKEAARFISFLEHGDLERIADLSRAVSGDFKKLCRDYETENKLTFLG